MTNGTSPRLVWKDDEHLRINDVDFHLSVDTAELQVGKSTTDSFLLGKPRQMVEDSARKGEGERFRKIFEMGILQGGSMAMYDQIFSPEKIVAIEHVNDPVNILANYIATHGRSDAVKPYYGINQADRPAMEKILSTEFPDRDIDFIVDDASHLYDETREAFNICFPYLKSGGLYVIEDWAWAHWSGDYWQKDNAYFSGRQAMSNLLVELFMLTASRPDFIKDILVEPSVISIRKGYGGLPGGKFDIGDHYLLRGRPFKAWL